MLTATRAREHATAAGEFPAGLTAQEREIYARIPDDIDFVPHPSFEARGTEAELFGPRAEEIAVPQWTDFPEVADAAAAPRRKRSKLSGADEAQLFVRYNYARWRLHKLLAAPRRRRTLAAARRAIRWYTRAMQCRADLVRANMALVLAMAKRTRIPNVEFGELVSEGNMALLRSVEKFDASRGFKFSTYACRAILKGFNRLATKTGRYRQHFPTEFDPDLERSDYELRRHEDQRNDSIDAVREILAQNRASLSDVERKVVMERFAIGGEGRGRTLSEVGRMVGLTNERVRQIQLVALGKIRAALDEGYLVA